LLKNEEFMIAAIFYLQLMQVIFEEFIELTFTKMLNNYLKDKCVSQQYYYL